MSAIVKKIGFLVPSSNTVLEPMTSAMVAPLHSVSLHFARLPVTEISLNENGLEQFQERRVVDAAELLAHARVDMVVWNGTAGSWLGLRHDERLCDAILQATGLPASTSTLAFHSIFKRMSVRRIGLVTPYTEDVQRQIVRVWADEGVDCVSERHLGVRDNFAFGEVSEDVIASMVQDVIEAGSEAVAIVCTNMRGARLAPILEAKFGVPVIDSVAVTLKACMDYLELSTAMLSGWGSIFDLPVEGNSLPSRQGIAEAAS